MYPFTYHRPENLPDAIAKLAADSDARPLAGGMTLIPSMKHRLSAPSQLIDIAHLPELRGIARRGDSLIVGAASRYIEIAADPLVASELPALAQVAQSIGDPQVRARGTIGGSVANSDPAADFPAAVLALAAVIATDRREIAADDFFQGMFTTALAAGELIREIRFAIPRRAAYAKFHHPASGYAMTGVFVADFGETVRVGVTGAAPVVFRWHEAEAALIRRFDPDSVAALALDEQGLNADMHAPASYRAQLAAVMLQDAVQALTKEGSALQASALRDATPPESVAARAGGRGAARASPIGGTARSAKGAAVEKGNAIELTVNGRSHRLEVSDRTLLADLLRDELRLTGTHVGCDTSQCGCCTIHMDGVALKSCTMLAAQADGASITTIEGLAPPGELHPVQSAFSACHGLQCGFCTPGMIMATVDLLERHPDPSDEQIRLGLAGNLCRCTGYVNIEAAVRTAASAMREQVR